MFSTSTTSEARSDVKRELQDDSDIGGGTRVQDADDVRRGAFRIARRSRVRNQSCDFRVWPPVLLAQCSVYAGSRERVTLCAWFMLPDHPH